MPESMQNQIVALLNKAGEEHGEYERSTLNGDYDTDWSSWYAAWLVEHGINDLLNSDMISSDLADLLADIHELHQQTSQRLGWAAYTAQKLIDTAMGAPRTN